jgi:chemotaxis protein CheX
MTISQNDLCQLTCAIWESTLGLAVQPIPGPGLSEQEASTVVGRVRITGAWRGEVLLECSEELAKKVARAMFGLDSEEPTPDEVRDALGEITNVTAGNLKSLVRGDCHLAMPHASDRVPDPAAISKHVPISHQAFDCEGARFVVAILEG